MHPRTLSIAEFSYILPDEKIALHPLPVRDQSRLLIYKNGEIREGISRDIAKQIPVKSLMVFNNTRVIEARILFQKSSGGVIELFCLEPAEQMDPGIGLQSKSPVRWQCLVGGASKWKPGQVLVKKMPAKNEPVVLEACYIEKKPGYFIIEFKWSPGEYSFSEILHLAGAIPLPPYIKRNVVEEDESRYQTTYALQEGSVAAPTAGLHFTDEIFKELSTQKIQTGYITLHVGAGTFKPVQAETLAGHYMHGEYFEASARFLKMLLENLESKVIAVGTTSLRTIESLYWLGVKLMNESETALNTSNERTLQLSQWECYDLKNKNISGTASIAFLLEWMKQQQAERLVAKTQLLIAPGYHFNIVSGLVTNFHQPGSTLLLLVAAFIGEDWKKVYNYALDNEFRFLSYGDGSLLFRN